jgi:uncharacterized repeat protein (TIGR02543 family)
VQVTLTATPSTGYRFVSWTGDAGTVANVTAATTSIMMSSNCTVTANFATEIIEIWDWYDLDTVRDNLDGSYLLMNDLSSTTAGYMELASEIAGAGMGWDPIGDSDYGFTGNFNGQGYEISDLFINRPNQNYVGLFGHVSWSHPVETAGHIENVGLVNAHVTGSYRVGVLVGHSAGTVSNSYSTGSETTGGHYVGGLVGYNNAGNVSDSYSACNVSAERYAGGLVGRITGVQGVRKGVVRDCRSASSVTGFVRVGGLVGSTFSDVDVSNSCFSGSVTGHRWVGGLVAENYGGNVSNSYSVGDVAGDGGYVGNLVGLNLLGTVSDCYSAGTVSAAEGAGSLIGGENQGTVNNSFWDTETSGQSTSDGGTGKTTSEMKSMATFSGAGWNIVAVADSGVRDTSCIWNIVDGDTYPFLSRQP